MNIFDDQPELIYVAVFVAAICLLILLFAGFTEADITDSMYQEVIDVYLPNPMSKPLVIEAMQDGSITVAEFDDIKSSVNPKSILIQSIESEG
ncbi:exported hypothetical protein [Vibrio nigripulchritudo FTn2]|uniref:hypothetical protein n=1 Tax=Vibrio nigripulchritudo TaxID=28173 RepID=UPI0003B21BE2|nr:hypothetical protein [Vibrio nigripulchritudo]CCN40365.1 exported hypothetical protein [Vibrio nigripulchritudo FTn2]